MIPALLGAAVGLGLFIIWQGATGRLSRSEPTERHRERDDVNRRVLIAVVCAVIVFAATGWPVGMILAGCAGWWGPAIVGAQRRRTASIERTEAIAAWTEQLRDVVSASAGISEALASTARVAPLPIRSEVADLARRLRREDADSALAMFAADLDDATGDQVIVALRLSITERGERLSEVLTAISEAARDQADLYRQTEASRSKLWRQASTVTIVMIGVLGLVAAFQRDYLAAYDTLPGQIVLGVVGVLWGVSLKMMVDLASITAPTRLLNASALRSAATS